MTTGPLGAAAARASGGGSGEEETGGGEDTFGFASTGYPRTVLMITAQKEYLFVLLLQVKSAHKMLQRVLVRHSSPNVDFPRC